jgi:hypothetical protein
MFLGQSKKIHQIIKLNINIRNSIDSERRGKSGGRQEYKARD